MATEYQFADGANTSVRLAGFLTPDPLASPTFTGTVTLPAVVVGSALPTADPHVAGQLWANSGVVTVSAG